MGCGSSSLSRDPWTLAAEGSIAALAQWIDAGGSVGAVDTAKGRGTLLHAAARADQVECIKLLLKCGAHVDQTTPELGSPLHVAAAAGAGNAVTVLLANGASTSLRLGGATAAELAQRQGYPATAGLIRMTQETPPARDPAADSRAAERASAAAVAQQQQQRAAAAQRAAQQARLREIQKQINAVDPQPQLSALDMPWRSSSEPSGMPSFHAHTAGPAFRLSPDRTSLARQPRQLSAGPSVLGPTSSSGELQQQQAAQPAEARPTPPSSGHSGPGRQESGGTAAREASPPAPPSPRGGAAPAAGAGGSSRANGAAAGQPALRHDDSLDRSTSDGLERVASDASKCSGDSPRIGADSLVNDPLLKFVRQAMLSKLPSNLNRTTSGLGRQPAAAAAAAAVAEAAGATGEASQRQGTQQQQAQGEGGQGAGGTVLTAGGAAHGADVTRDASGETLTERPSGGSAARGSSLSLSIDIRPWEIQFEDLGLQKTIGEGSFGKVYVAIWHETLVAVKVLLDLEEAQQAAGPDAVWTLSNPILWNLQKECTLMASLRHPNVVQFMGFSALPPSMVTEYCAKGSLADVLKAAAHSPAKARQLTWLRRLNMALDATKGMLYLHKRGIIHRDLKSPNLLVESTWKVKVADFNLSKIVEDTGSGRSTMANMNPRWLAPEILNGESATAASDVFSWGVVMWELLTFQLPWPHVGPWGLVGKLMDGHRLKIPPRDELPGADTASFGGLDDYVALLQRCWAQEPAERPTFEEVIHELREMLQVQARTTA